MTDLPIRSPGRTLAAAALATVALAVMPPVAAAQAPGFITQWGTPGTGNGQFNFPAGVATDAAGNVYVADANNNRIQKFTSDGTYLAQWGSYGAGAGQFNDPIGIAADAAGSIYVVDKGNCRVQKFTSDGTYLAQWGSRGIAPGQLMGPDDIATDAMGNVYVVDDARWRVEKYTSDGTYVTQWGSQCCTQPPFNDYAGQFTRPFGIAVDAAGNVYVSDADASEVQKFTSDGTYLGRWGSLATTPYPYGMTSDAAGNVYVAVSPWVEKVSGDGTVLATWGSDGSGPGQFNVPLDVAVDAAGNVYVSDPLNSRIEKFGFLPTPTKPISWGGLKRLYR